MHKDSSQGEDSCPATELQKTTLILISTGKMHDVNAMEHMDWEPGCWYVMDRGDLDFERLYHIHQCQAGFVTRSKKNTQYKRVYSKKMDKSKGILCDPKVRLTGTNALKDYPELIRRIKFIGGETGKRLVFLTNNMMASAATFRKFTKIVGTSGCSSNGSNNTCASSDFSVERTTPCGHKLGLRCAFTS